MSKINLYDSFPPLSVPTGIDAIKKALLLAVDNSGTYGSPTYGAGDTYKLSFEDFFEIFPYLGVPVTQKRVLTAAEIKTLASVPIALVDSPGVGYFINPIAVTAYLNYGSVTFNSPDPKLNVTVGSTTCFQTVDNLINQGFDYIIPFKQLLSPSTPELRENQPFEIKAGADSTLGDGSVTIYFTYCVLPI